MHCWKIINIDRDYGQSRIAILSCITFFITFSFSYVLLSLDREIAYTDDNFMIFLILFVTLYPIHKLLHYFLLLDYTKFMKVKIRVKYKVIPFIHLKINQLVPKWRYILSLVAPFITLTTAFLFLSIQWPAYTHYCALLLGVHCMICLIDFLTVREIYKAPKKAFIEETPKGYEVLIPLET